MVRIENLLDAAPDYVPELLRRANAEYLRRTYKVEEWRDATHFLEQLAVRTGKLLKGGEADTVNAAKIVLNDWVRGRIPYFVPPPQDPDRPVPAAATATATAAPDTATPAAAASGAAGAEGDEAAEGKAKAEEAPVVKQLLGKLVVREEFRNERGVAEEEAAEESVVDWDEVYASVVADDAAGDEDLPDADAAAARAPKRGKPDSAAKAKARTADADAAAVEGAEAEAPAAKGASKKRAKSGDAPAAAATKEKGKAKGAAAKAKGAAYKAEAAPARPFKLKGPVALPPSMVAADDSDAASADDADADADAAGADAVADAAGADAVPAPAPVAKRSKAAAAAAAEEAEAKRRVSVKELKKRRGAERRRIVGVEKEERRATNKTSARNFYTGANVKNRNLRRTKDE